ncbi:MAG: TetR/AcrR family transcriptional regulator [Cellvibrionaceae bacterium]|nr:TetR/AcrR family transcriptional regulator [Cellvibrionaceae bacterium]
MSQAQPSQTQQAELAQLVSQGLVTDPASPKGRLLAASAQLFKQKGFAGTTVRDIAAEVGILSGSIFHHFPNKESILKAVMAEAILTCLARMESAVAKLETTPARFRALVRCELEAIHGISGVGFTLLTSEWRCLSADSQAEILKLRQRYEGLHREVLADAKAQGWTQVEPFLLRHFMRGALAETSNWFHLNGDLSLEDLVDQICLAAGMRPS